ncbi:MAG: hypothetical protein ABJB22_02395 [Verrucomicrobiota bacterium]
MNEQFQEDRFDALLREAVPYIDDAGFTARVVQRLPVRRQRRSSRAFILCCITLLASVITYTVSGGGQFLVSGINRMATLPILWILVLAAFCSLLFASIAAAAALSRTRGEPLG